MGGVVSGGAAARAGYPGAEPRRTGFTWLPAGALVSAARALAAAPDLTALAVLLAGAVADYLGIAGAVALPVPGEGAVPALRVQGSAGFRGRGLAESPLAPAGPVVRAWRGEVVAAAADNLEPEATAAALAAAGVERLRLLPLPGRAGTRGLLLLDATARLSPGALAAAEALAVQAGLAAIALTEAEEAQRLAAAGAHEVRNALAVARGLVQLAALQPERAGAHLPAALTAMDRAAALAGDLLTLARPVWLHCVPVDLAALTDAVLQGCDTAGVAVERRYCPGLPPVPADPDRLRQIIYNLINNALAAMEGQGTLTLRACAERGAVCLAVSDSGPGIAPQHLPHLFTPFFTTRPGGSGLGLTICRRLAEAHGGSIAVASPSGAGATFTLCLPLGRTDRAVPANNSPKLPA